VASFSRSGAANQSKVVVSGVSVNATSLFLATVQGSAKRVWVRGAAMNSPTTFTIYLNQAPTAPVKVAWFVLN
jgi:hypothetical protein